MALPPFLKALEKNDPEFAEATEKVLLSMKVHFLKKLRKLYLFIV
jgi:hypothetical protein